MTSPINRLSAAEQISAHIRQRILAGDLRSGDPLREADLAATFDVARNTIREALRLLTSDGLASHEVHRGVTVRRFSATEVHDTFGLRRIFEETAAERAGTLTEPEIAQMEKILEASAEALAGGDSDRLLALNLDFHRGLAALSGNARVLSLFDQMTAEILLMVGPIKDEMTAQWLGRNQELFRLLREGRATEFRAMLRAYLDDAREAIVHLTGRH